MVYTAGVCSWVVLIFSCSIVSLSDSDMNKYTNDRIHKHSKSQGDADGFPWFAFFF